MKNINHAVATHDFFNGMKPEHLALVTEGAKALEFAAGDMVCREGEPANQLYLVESGKIALEIHEPNDGTMLVQTIGAGEVLGWSWLFPPFVWHFQARVIQPANLIALSGAHLLNTAEGNSEFGYELMKRVAQVAIHRNQAIRKQLVALNLESVMEG